MKKFAFFIAPLLLFIGLVVFLFQGLYSNPRERESMVLDQPVPAFSLPDLMHAEIVYTPAVFRDEITILNVWGVWCITCAVELPYLTELAKERSVRLVGLYFDHDLDPEFGSKTLPDIQKEVDAMLSRFGNPYAFNILDVQRDLSLDLGVTGAPEHFVIDHHGVVRLHHVGDINERVWQHKFASVITALEQERELAL